MPAVPQLPQITPGETTKDDDTEGPGIRCPKCKWRPHPSDLWACDCGHQWHTFDTGGICPVCMHQWTSTQCPMCGEWSAHSDWYV